MIYYIIQNLKFESTIRICPSPTVHKARHKKKRCQATEVRDSDWIRSAHTLRRKKVRKYGVKTPLAPYQGCTRAVNGQTESERLCLPHHPGKLLFGCCVGRCRGSCTATKSGQTTSSPPQQTEPTADMDGPTLRLACTHLTVSCFDRVLHLHPHIPLKNSRNKANSRQYWEVSIEQHGSRHS